MADGHGSDSDFNNFDRGLRLLQKLGGVDRPAVLDLFESVGEQEFGAAAVGFVYGGVYHRPGLSLQERQFATIGGLTALGYASAQLQFHIKAALNVGCSQQQIIEAIIQVSSYAGLPATLNALYAAKEVLDTVAGQRDTEAVNAEPDLVDIEDRYERGLAFMERIDGEAGKRVVETLRDIAPDLARYLIEYTFGEIYPRLHLSLKHREIVTVAACTALGTALPQLKVHLHGLLNVGGTQREVIETLLHMAFYSGFPSALNAIAAAREVFAERMAS